MTILRSLSLGSVALAAFLLVPPGCGTTGSARFEFAASVGGIARDASQPFTFVNATGWHVTLTEATMTLGPVYLNTIPALRSGGWLGLAVRTAHAHGEDHLGSGRYIGQVLEQTTVDTLSPTLVAFKIPGDMTEETVRTGEVWFYPPPGIDPSAIDITTEALRVRGTATKDGQTVSFRGSLILNDAWLPDVAAGDRGATTIASIRQVRGVDAVFHPSQGGTLEVRIDASAFFRGADFATLAQSPTDPDGTKVLVQSKAGTDAVMKNMYTGLHAAKGTYTFVWH